MFNQFDQPGRYLYLRDDDSGDFWSASWQPVGKDLAHYRSRCCHGMGYTRMLADYAGISSEATYYVPDGCAYEVWALRGQGQRAYTYFAENAPAAQNDRAEVRHLEPYCYGQFTEGPASKHFGRSQVHWLTGTASTVMVGCVEGILGLRPDLDGLRLAPAIPREWTGFTMDKDFRGCRLHIRVENPHHRESGFTSLTVNGRELPDAYIPAALLTRETEVCLIL